MAACPTKASRSTPSQPSRTAAPTSTGWTTTPIRPGGREHERAARLVDVEAGEQPVAEPEAGTITSTEAT